MGAIFKYLTVFFSVLLVSAGFAWADTKPPAVGGQLPEFTLPLPKSDESFKISDISADVVIIEIFSMY
jgi:hypothetical protein